MGSPQTLAQANTSDLVESKGIHYQEKASSNLKSELVFHSKVIAKEPIKQCGRQPVANTGLTKRQDDQGVSQTSKASSLSLVAEFPLWLMS